METPHTSTHKEKRTCDTPAIVFHLIAVHSHLVTSNHGLESIVLAEPLRNIWAKLHANASFTWSSARFGLWICP